MKNKSIVLALSLLVGILFSGCTTMMHGTTNSLAFVSNSITGIEYPKKNGKIYIESTTKEDTKHLNKYNAQINGFDNIVIEDVMQCDSKPELIDVLTSNGWEITNNKSEADYQLSVSSVMCGYTTEWLKWNQRFYPFEKRSYYKAYKEELKGDKYVGKEIDIQNENIEVLKQFLPIYDVANFNNYVNIFAYKYDKAPESIKKLANHKKSERSWTSWSNSSAENSSASHGISTGARVASTGNTKGGLAIAGVGMLMSFSSAKKYSGYNTEVKIYNPATKKTSVKYYSGILFFSGFKTYDGVKHDANVFARGLFYK